MSHTALEIATKILAMPNLENEEPISNLKLQKLLYYVQGFNLARFGEPLFTEPIEAWLYGPVVPCVYEHFKEYGSQGILIEKEEKIVELCKEQDELFNKVYEVYNAFSAIGLMNLTHSESPWKSTEHGRGHIIEHDKLKAFFKTRLK